MSGSMAQAFAQNFLGHSPRWYKATIVGFLILNALVLFTVGPVAAGWLLVIEFIFTLAMALKCYPLLPGGLLMIQALPVQYCACRGTASAAFSLPNLLNILRRPLRRLTAPSSCPAELTPSLSTARRWTVAGAVSLSVKVKLCVLKLATPAAKAPSRPTSAGCCGSCCPPGWPPARQRWPARPWPRAPRARCCRRCPPLPATRSR